MSDPPEALVPVRDFGLTTELREPRDVGPLPEQKLLSAIVAQAIPDLFGRSTQCLRRDRVSAARFLFHPDPDASGFAWMAECCGLDPEAVREALVARFQREQGDEKLQRLLREGFR